MKDEEQDHERLPVATTTLNVFLRVKATLTSDGGCVLGNRSTTVRFHDNDQARHKRSKQDRAALTNFTTRKHLHSLSLSLYVPSFSRSSNSSAQIAYIDGNLVSSSWLTFRPILNANHFYFYIHIIQIWLPFIICLRVALFLTCFSRAFSLIPARILRSLGIGSRYIFFFKTGFSLHHAIELFWCLKVSM